MQTLAPNAVAISTSSLYARVHILAERFALSERLSHISVTRSSKNSREKRIVPKSRSCIITHLLNLNNNKVC